MIKSILSLFILLSMPLFAFTEAITLREPPSSLKAQYVKEVLTIAYASLGYSITWLDVDGVKELEYVQTNKLDAALARADIIEKKFPSLTRVPFPILRFELLKVSDRLRCGYCLNEDIRSITYSKGSLISEKYADSLKSKVHKFPITNTDNLNEMLIKRRVDSVLLMDFELDEQVAINANFIIETVNTQFDYHYLSTKYKHLKQPLLMAFNSLKQQGVLLELQIKYGIDPKIKVATKESDKVSLVSGNWADYTNADGSGVYWQLMDIIFSSELSVIKNVSIWERAVKEFERGEADVLVGAYRTNNLVDVIYSSYHLDYEYPLYAIGQNNEVIKRYKNKDESLIICSEVGSSSYKQVSFLSGENIIQTSEAQCQKLMRNGKIDIVLEYGYKLAKSLQKLPKIVLIENSPLFLVFHDTPHGRFLKRYFDRKISDMAINNTLKLHFLDDDMYKQAHIRP